MHQQESSSVGERKRQAQFFNIPSLKNVNGQRSNRNEEKKKFQLREQAEVKQIYQVILNEQQKQRQNLFLQPNQLLGQQERMGNSLDKDLQILSRAYTSDKCQYCQNFEKGRIIHTTCNHFYHFECFQQYLEVCVKKGLPLIYCNCKAKINQKTILSNTNQVIIRRLFENQYSKIKTKYFKYYIFEKCSNSYCNFFWMKNPNIIKKSSILKYCPTCLEKNFEIGVQMEQIFYHQ